MELIYSRRGRARKLSALPGDFPTMRGTRWVLDQQTDEAFVKSATQIKELLNLDVSHVVILRAALRELHAYLTGMLEDAKADSSAPLTEKQLCQRYKLRVLLHMASLQRIK
jgi:hypothetical protein